MTLLEVATLRAGYGQLNVLHELDFTVEAGEVVVVLGANGAGKTTTMRAISGTIAHGSMLFDGRQIAKLSPDRVLKLGIAQVPQGRGTFPELSVHDNLRAGAITRRGDRAAEVAADIERWYDTFPRLRDRREQRAGNLSGGEQQMLAIARALMSRPKLLLCDEPSLGLAPIIIQEMFRVIERLNRDEGLAVLLVEQNAHLAMRLARRVYVLETGHMVAAGTAAELSADDSIRKAYLGF